VPCVSEEATEHTVPTCPVIESSLNAYYHSHCSRYMYNPAISRLDLLELPLILDAHNAPLFHFIEPFNHSFASVELYALRAEDPEV
jgi:hypothetical protein